MVADKFDFDLLDHAINPIIIVDMDSSIVYVNPAFERLTGFSSEELLGRKQPYPWWGKKDLEDRIISPKVINKSMYKGSRIQRKDFDKDGNPFWVKSLFKPLVRNGECKYIMMSYVDDTQRRKSDSRIYRLKRKLRNSFVHIQSAREQERAKIARELHDEIGQALIALKMDISWLERKVHKGKDSPIITTQRMNKVVDMLLQKVKWLSTGLRQDLIEDIGLANTMDLLVFEFQSINRIKCKISISRESDNIDKSAANSICRILQEALTNVSRHSEASNISVTLQVKTDEIVFRIHDNGKGISKEEITDPKSFGIIGMKESIHSCGGKINIQGVKDRGTTITVKYPLRVEGNHDKYSGS